jgi:hypothetical protein
MISENSTIDTLNFASFIQNFHGGVSDLNQISETSTPGQNVDLQLSATSSFDPSYNPPKSMCNTYLKYALYGLIIYAVYLFFNRRRSKRSKRSRVSDS